MRVLFSCAAADGHFLPLVPLARAFRERGDEVAVATAESYAPRIEATGLAALSAGIDQRALDARFAPYAAEIQRLPIPERRPHAFRDRFALLDSPARLDELYALAATWKPDVLIHESAELAAPAVASALGLPSVHHGFGRPVPQSLLTIVAPVAAAMWERLGLQPAPLAGAFRGTYVDICPPGLDGDPPPEGTPVLPLRPVDRSDARPGERPLIYITLGTAVRGVEVFRLLLAAFADLDADVLVTTGRQNDPAELGPLPANATVERYVPQAEVLPRSSLVVTHGGSGSMLGALAQGLPLLVVPHQADQFGNAAAAAQAGAARVLMPDDLQASAVRADAIALLHDPGYRRAAEGIAAEIGAMPSPAAVADQLAASIG